VLDVGAAPGIGNRSFGDDAAIVTEYGRAVADGLTEAGVLPVFKHFPGHGRASVDSHLGLPLVPSIDELWASDLLPYVELVGDHRRDGAAVMVGHLSVPGLSGDLPTSLSPETINGLLKNQIGFDGLVFTDAMNMGAIVENFGTLDAIVRAFGAGADIAILGSLADVTPVLDHLVATAAGDPGFEALLELRAMRVLGAKGQAEICVGAQ
jgi:beta-N-acetylhexosaminidase